MKKRLITLYGEVKDLEREFAHHVEERAKTAEKLSKAEDLFMSALLAVDTHPTSSSDDPLYLDVKALGFSLRTVKALDSFGIKLVTELVRMKEQDLLKRSNFGRKSLKEVKDVLHGMGFHLGMKLDGP